MVVNVYGIVINLKRIKNFKSVSLLIFLFSFLSCGTYKQPSLSPWLKDGRLVYTLPDSELTLEQRELKMSYVDKIPDSLLTVEQLEMKRSLEKVVLNFLKVENNRFVFRMKRSVFLKESNLPEVYYNRIKNEIKTNNRFIKENKMRDVEKMFQNTVEYYRKDRKEL